MQHLIITDFKEPVTKGSITSEGQVCLSLELKENRFAVQNDTSFAKLKKLADKKSGEFEATLIISFR